MQYWVQIMPFQDLNTVCSRGLESKHAVLSASRTDSCEASRGHSPAPGHRPAQDEKKSSSPEATGRPFMQLLRSRHEIDGG